MSQFFTLGGQSIGVSASTSVLPMNVQNWFPLGWTGWISLRSTGLSRAREREAEAYLSYLILFRASLVALSVKNPPAVWETWVGPLGWEDPLEEGMETPSSVFTQRIPMDRGAWRATVLGVSESDTTERLTQHNPFYKWGDSSPGDNKSRMPLTATSLTHSLFPTRNISFKAISAYLF